MAFIVVMVWGRPHELVVEDIDNDGDAVYTVVPNDGPPDPEWRRFSCHGSVWEQMLDFGRMHGWEPSGTLPSDRARKRWDELGKFDDSYKPSDWYYLKQVTGNDAAALADALERAILAGETAASERASVRPTLIVEGMTQAEFFAANRGLSEPFLRDFVAFLRKGPFNFAWDD